MAQSLAQIWIHLVFSTKNRVPWISPAWQADLHDYLGGTLKGLDCAPERIGGSTDHVHLLFGLSRKTSFSRIVQEIKTSSGAWLRAQGLAPREFRWQAGYGAFSVSGSNLGVVRKYIEDQDTHHAKRTFQDEFRALLRRHAVAFDEKYIWD